MMKFVTALFLFCATATLALAESDSKKASGPPFFLIDTSDQLCLGGEEFKRCSIDTLFFVVGSPGKHSFFETAFPLFLSHVIFSRSSGVFLLNSHPRHFLFMNKPNDHKATTKFKTFIYVQMEICLQ